MTKWLGLAVVFAILTALCGGAEAWVRGGAASISTGAVLMNPAGSALLMNAAGTAIIVKTP